MEPKVNMTLPDGTTTPIVTILTGEYEHPDIPLTIKLAGDIDTVSNFLKQRYAGKEGYGHQFVDKTKTIVIVDRKERTILLRLDPQSEKGTDILAKLEISEELKQFGINTTQMFNREQLIKLIRFNARFFPNKENYEKVLYGYQRLNISTESIITAASDTRGNKEAAFKKSVKAEGIPDSFQLRLPIFKGQEEKSFFVEICVDVSESSVRFWFESVELHELIQIEQEIIFNKQLQSCQDFPIIYK